MQGVNVENPSRFSHTCTQQKVKINVQILGIASPNFEKNRLNALKIDNSNLCIKDFINIVYKYMSLHNGLNILTTSLRVGFQ